MSTPEQSTIEQDLVELLRLVDTSRAQAAAAEATYVQDMRVLFASRAQETASENDDSPLITAAFLAGAVALIRKALTAGVAEGARFARAQALTLDLPVDLLGVVEFSEEALGAQLVADFLAGQVAVAKDASDKAAALKEMLRRAEIAVVSAVQAGRGLATEEFLATIAELLSGTVHKLWVARFDLTNPPCALCTRLHGTHVPLGQPFSVLETEPDPYGGKLAHPPRHPNCRCSIVLFFPDSASKVGLSAESMQAFASWALSATDEERAQYLAATIVHVKPYTRMVNGHLQQVSGYFYDTKTGMKIPDTGGAPPSPHVKEVSHKQAKAINKVAKAANKATPQGGAVDLDWKPGTYKVDLPGDDDTQVIVHQDGSSTAIHKGRTEDSDKSTTAQFLSLHKQNGTVTKISDDPEVPDPEGPGPQMEMNDDLKKNGTLPEGSYVFTDNKDGWGGVQVNPDGTGTIYKSDFKKSFPLQQVAIKQIANGSLGDLDEVDDSDFNEDWYKQFRQSKAGDGKAPDAPSIPNQAEPGDRGKGLNQPSPNAPNAPNPQNVPGQQPQQQNVPGQAPQQSAPNAPNSNVSEPGDRPQSKKNANGQKAPDFTAKLDVAIPDEPPLPDTEDRMATGIALLDPDGSIWIYEPKDHYAGYEHTFPKGGMEKNLSPQQNAHKELWEETGLEGEITGYLGDFKRSGGGKVRMYVGKRTGGQPLPDDASPYEPGGSETASVKKVSLEEAADLLNVNRDKRILKDVVKFGEAGRAPAVAGDAQPVPGPDGVPEDLPAPVRPRFNLPEAPEGGPGGVVKGGPSLFSVGEHSVQMEEGAQVYKSGKSKDTLYVLQPNGDLIKYNPQGAGVQAKLVGSSENPAARAQLLSGLNNVTDEGVSIQNAQPLPGTGKALVGGFELTSTQLEQAINALSANPSGNVAADLKRVGSPLAAGKFHEVAAPYKAYYNNKTKPALIAALKNAHAKTGSTPLDETPAVSHLQNAHGLEDHQASLGHSDHEAIHAALHAVDPQGFDHTHEPASPGFISFGGVPVTPQAVAEALDALQSAPKSETGIKKPLKAIGSPLSGVDLQGHANTSPLTNSFKGSNGKVHYGKLKPAVIALLQDALDKHQTDHPPIPSPAAVLPDVSADKPGIQGVLATPAQIKEMQNHFAQIDFDLDPSFGPEKFGPVAHNPLAHGVDWPSFMQSHAGPDKEIQPHEMNKALFDGLNKYLDRPTSQSQLGPVQTPGPDESPKVKLGEIDTSVDQIAAFKNLFDHAPANIDPDDYFENFKSSLPSDSAFKNVSTQTELSEMLNVDALSYSWKQDISDALQFQMDQAALQLSYPPETPEAPSTVSIAGKSVTKQQILDAIDAVKNSSSTSVKAPLKAIDSPLAKSDLKTFIESDPLSAPFKGGNGKVHYGKLKEAVVAVLQGKADNMSAQPSEIVGPDSDPDVTSVDVGAPSPSAPDVAPVDDFFNDGPPTTNVPGGNLTVSQLAKNAKDSPDVGDSSFADAFQQAVKNEETWYYSTADGGTVSSDEGFVEGGSYYEIMPDDMVVSYINGEDVKQLSNAEIADLIGNNFQTSGLASDLAGTDLPEVGFYQSPGGMALKVFPDGTGLSINTATGQNVKMENSDLVKNMLEMGTWDKISDLPENPNAAIVNGVEVGHYAPGGGVSYSVQPDGSVFIMTPSGESMVNVDAVKTKIQSSGVSPGALQVEPESWMKEALKDPNGLLLGDYKMDNGFVVHVDENGPDGVHPALLGMNLMDGYATFQTHTAVLPGDVEDDVPSFEEQIGAALDSPELTALVNKVADAGWQDAWADTTTPFSQAFQTAIKNHQTVYLTGLGQGNLISTGASPQVGHYKFFDDGIVQKVDNAGAITKVYSPAELVAKLDHVYDGPSAAPSLADAVPEALPTANTPNLPDAPDEIAPDGYWNDKQVGIWTDGSTLVTLGPDGPDGMSASEFLGKANSGDLTWLSPPESPVASTPAHMYDADAPVLQPFMTAGYYTPGWLDKPQLLAAAKKWAADSGFDGIAAKHLNSATKKEDLVDWMNAWANGEWDKAYEIESKKVQQHTKRKVHPGSPENPANAGGFVKKKMPPLVPGEIPAGVTVEGNWPDPNHFHLWDNDIVDAYLLKANMQHPTGLTANSKRKWAVFHASGNKIATDSFSYLGQKNVAEGDILSSPILPPVEKYAPGQAVPLGSDFPDIDHSKSAVSGWTNNQLDTYLNHIGPTKKSVDFLSKQSPETKAQIVSLHAVAAAPSGSTTFKDPSEAKAQIQDILSKAQEIGSWNEESTTAFIHNALKLDKKTYTMNAEQPPLGGGSSSEIWQLTDEQGNPFLFKVAPEKFRAEVEHASHKLAELAGIKVADSQLGTFNGKYGQFQAKVPSQGTLMHVDPVDLPVSALKDLMAAHVQDWATANDDAHGDNFLLMPDGKHVMPIDIARSFVRFGQPGSMQLKVGQLSNWANAYYDKVYKAAIGGKLSDGAVDDLYRASMSQARKTAGVSDESWGSTITEGLKNRTNFGWTSAKDLPDLVSQAIARKNALPEDFEKFWDDIYSQIGREKPTGSTTASKWVYTGVSQDLLDHAEVMGAHGATAFFAGSGLEEGGLLAQVMPKASGGKELHLTGQLRKSADADFRAWLAGNVGQDFSGASHGSQSQVSQFLSSVGASTYQNDILGAAKTISHHHGLGDLNYNTGKIAVFEATASNIETALQKANNGEFPSAANSPELKQEYKNMLEYYSEKVRAVNVLKDNNGQSKQGDFDAYNFTMPAPAPIESPMQKDWDVKKINSYHDGGDLNSDGVLVLNGSVVTTGQTGKTYQITLADGTQIEYRSWHSHDGVKRAQQGQLRIKVRNYDGTDSGVQAARAALSQMGLDFTDAGEEDLELLYYRHLYGTMFDRVDGNQGKMKEVQDIVKAELPGGTEGTPALDAKEELERWRKAWSRLDPEKFNTFLAEKKWMPRFNRVNPSSPNLRGGQPFWERFDYDENWLSNYSMPVHTLYDPGKAADVVKSGGLMSAEDRTKMLGKWLGGMSSEADQGRGSSNNVYLRQNKNANSSSYNVLLNPSVMKRTTNYAFNGDFFGEIDYKSQSAYFDPKKAASHTNDRNELMIKRMVSLLDDIEMIFFTNEANRQEALDFLKSKGVTMIRGLSIEDRLIGPGVNREAAVAKVKDHMKTWEEDEL